MQGWVADFVVTAVLVGMLAICFAPVRGLIQALAGLCGVVVVALTGSLTIDSLETSLRLMLPVVLFLCATLVVAEACRAEGLFAALGDIVHRRAGASGTRLVLWGFLLAAAVTVVLSLDATVVLLTPVLIAAGGAGQVQRPLAHLCVRLANSASLLLPVSNLTNLLALPEAHLSFVSWVAAMAPVWVAVLVVEYVGVRVFFRRDVAAPVISTESDVTPLRRGPVVVLALMLVGFAVSSPLGIEPWVVAVAAALVLVTLARRELGWRAALGSAQLPFGLFVLCLGVVVTAVGAAYLHDVVAELVPGSTGFWALLGIATLATLVANLVNNLPATLLIIPLVAPLGTDAVFAALLGLNVGAGLTYPGSLANLLWRRTLMAEGQPPSGKTFHLHAALVTPFALAAGVAVVALV